MRAALARLALGLLVASGGGAACEPSAPAHVANGGGTGAAPTAEMLSRAARAALCPLVLGKLYPLHATHGDAQDAYVWVRECRTDVRPEGLTLHASAAVWMVVDRDVGPVHLEQFVQATLSIDVAYAVTATYRVDHAEVSLRPLAKPRLDVEAVGALDPQPLNWAALAAENLVPSLGTTSEWVAKTAARDEAEKALASVLGQELQVGIDAQRDRLWVGAAAPAAAPMSAHARQSVRVAAHGTALLGPFEGDASLAVIGVVGGARALAQAFCPEDLQRLLARDRRAESLDTTTWVALEPGSKLTQRAPRSCSWMLALRTGGVESITVELDAQSIGKSRHLEPGVPLAISIESVAVDPALAKADLDVWLVGGDERVRVLRPPRPSEPHVFIVPAGEPLRVQTTLRGEPAILSEAPVTIHADRTATEESVIVKDHEGNPGAVRIRMRVLTKPRFAGGALRP